MRHFNERVQSFEMNKKLLSIKPDFGYDTLASSVNNRLYF